MNLMAVGFNIHRSTLVGAIALSIFLLCCFAYYMVFAADLNRYDGDGGFFQLALNSHDHFIYLDVIELIRDRGLEFLLINNDIGIAAIYLFLSSLFSLLVNPELTLISILFNCIILCFCYWVYASICDRLELGLLGKISFFANTSFIYFAQLINKDMLTVFAFLLAVQFGLKRKFWPLILLLPFLALVRQQLLVFVLIYIFFMQAPKPWSRIIIVYLITSLVAGLLSVFAPIIGEDSLGGGFSSFLVTLNQQYYVGYLIFNPVRVLQYVFDAFASFSFWTEYGGVDTAKILRIPQLIIIVLLFKPLSSLVTNFSYWLSTPAKPLVLVVVAYLMAWLMNPTINARYVMLIMPILVLFALYVRKHKFRAAQ